VHTPSRFDDNCSISDSNLFDCVVSVERHWHSRFRHIIESTLVVSFSAWTNRQLQALVVVVFEHILFGSNHELAIWHRVCWKPSTPSSQYKSAYIGNEHSTTSPPQPQVHPNHKSTPTTSPTTVNSCSYLQSFLAVGLGFGLLFTTAILLHLLFDTKPQPRTSSTHHAVTTLFYQTTTTSTSASASTTIARIDTRTVSINLRASTSGCLSLTSLDEIQVLI
jgi:hypothetical protein